MSPAGDVEPFRAIEIGLLARRLTAAGRAVIHLEFGQQFLGEQFMSGEHALEHKAILAAVIDFNVVIAGVDHPETRQTNRFVKFLLDDRVGAMFGAIFQAHAHGAVVFDDDLLHRGIELHLATKTFETLLQTGREIKTTALDQAHLPVCQQREEEQHEPRGHLRQK